MINIKIKLALGDRGYLENTLKDLKFKNFVIQTDNNYKYRGTTLMNYNIDFLKNEIKMMFCKCTETFPNGRRKNKILQNRVIICEKIKFITDLLYYR